jgi:hypothetical protein
MRAVQTKGCPILSQAKGGIITNMRNASKRVPHFRECGSGPITSSRSVFPILSEARTCSYPRAETSPSHIVPVTEAAAARSGGDMLLSRLDRCSLLPRHREILQKLILVYFSGNPHTAPKEGTHASSL